MTDEVYQISCELLKYLKDEYENDVQKVHNVQVVKHDDDYALLVKSDFDKEELPKMFSGLPVIV